MSDGLEIVSAGTALVSAGGGAGIVGVFMRWVQGRDAAALNTQLALLMQKVDQIAESQKKHDNFGERLALVEQSLGAAHERLDRVQAPRRKR